MANTHNIDDIVANRYRVIDILGEGGCGITYRVLDQTHNTTVALKVLSFSQTKNWKNVELIQREAKVLARLEHPGIPKYLDYFQVDSDEDRCFYLVQELAEGQPLSTLVESGWRCDEATVREIALQLLDILVYLRQQTPPIVHRDIKPQNILRTATGKLYLIDFGAVQDAYQSTFLRRSTVVGTYGYMAPEQFQGQAVHASDLYGLGTTLLYLLTHRSPTELPMERLKFQFRDRIHLSPAFADWLDRMVEPDVTDRFPSAKAALAHLKGEETPSPPTPEPSQNWSIPWAIPCFGLALLLLGAGFHLQRYAIANVLRLSGPLQAVASGQLSLPAYQAAGGNLQAIDRQGQSILHYAAQTGSPQRVQDLIQADLAVDRLNRKGESPLHWAGHPAIIDVLVTHGADVNRVSKQGYTPLAVATRFRVADALIHHGAISQRPPNQQFACLEGLIKNQRLSGSNAIYSPNSNTRPMPQDLRAHEMFAALLQKSGKNLLADFQAANGHSLLYDAALKTRSRLLTTYLVVCGLELSAADLELLKEDGYLTVGGPYLDTPIAVTIQLLVAAGLDVNFLNDAGQSPLYQAIGYEKMNIIKLLLSRNIDVNVRDHLGRTPLQAAEKEFPEAVDVLRAAGAKY